MNAKFNSAQIKILLCPLICLLWVSGVGAVNYYVDATSGNDLNSGLSQTEAWKNLTPLGSKTFAPGDIISLKRGCVWNHPLYTPGGGTQSLPVKISSYGSGVLPTIDGLKTSLGVYICASHIIIENLKIINTGPTSPGIADDSSKGHLYNITIQGCEIYAAYNAVNLDNCHGILLKNLLVYGPGNNGIRFGGSSWKVSDAVIEGCRVVGITGNDAFTIHEDGDGAIAGNNFIFRDCYAERAKENGFDLTTGGDILLFNSESRENGQGGVMVGHSAKRVRIDRHRSYDEPTTSMSGAANFGGDDHEFVILKNSIFQGNGYHLLVINTSNVFIYNNHFVWGGGSEIFDTGYEIDNITIKNNIFTTSSSGMGRIRFLNANRPPNHPTFYFDYNLYFAPNADTPRFLYNSVNYNFQNYRSTFGVEPHSMEIDPGFIDRTGGNFELSSLSKAIDQAITLPEVNTDFKGVVRPQGARLDIGAYEYVGTSTSPPSPPSGLEAR